MPQISRKEYSSLYGPTVGDRIRLGDTGLIIEIEKDLRGYGDESIYGGGKTLRAGMGGDSRSSRNNGVFPVEDRPQILCRNSAAADNVLHIDDAGYNVGCHLKK